MARLAKILMFILIVTLAACGEERSSSGWDIDNSLPDADATEADATEAETIELETTVEEIVLIEGGRAMPVWDFWATLANPTACVHLGLSYHSRFDDREDEFNIETPELLGMGSVAIIPESCAEARYSDAPRYAAISGSGRVVRDETGFVLDLVLNFDPAAPRLPRRVDFVSERADW
jgi:hypothetical protein